MRRTLISSGASTEWPRACLDMENLEVVKFHSKRSFLLLSKLKFNLVKKLGSLKRGMSWIYIWVVDMILGLAFYTDVNA